VRRRGPRSRLWLVALLVGATGCSFFGTRFRPVRQTSVAELLGDVAARRASLTSLRARVRLRSGLARMWTRQAVLVQRPSAIRVDVLSPFGLALALGTEGRTLWAFPPNQGVLYEGPATPANLARLLGTPLGVTDLVDVLLGVPPERQATATPTLERDGADWVLTVPYQGGTQRLRFATDTLELTRVEEQRDGGAPMRVTFGDYQDGFARALDLDGGGVSASIAFDQVEPNAAIDATAFAPPAAPRVLPLDKAAAPG
jgi:hypothetical protein